MTELNMEKVLRPVFENLSPKPSFLRIWPEDDEHVELVEYKFGLVPKGSVLHYQQPLPTNIPITDPNTCPEFEMPTLTYPDTALPEKEYLFYESLSVSREQSMMYEAQTREQSNNKDWHRLCQSRITASNFKSICSRQTDFESLSTSLMRGKVVQTAAMKYGIAHEGEAAQQYSEQFGRDIYDVGLVINPSVPHPGCSPDRRVHDPAVDTPWGLLEIKCSMAEELSKLQYLKFNELTVGYSLGKSHAYFSQVMGCLGLTGCKWGDFVVFCQNEFHCERIHFDEGLFSSMLDKLNLFYFQFHLSTLVHGNK